MEKEVIRADDFHPVCQICKTRHPFDMPDEVVEAAKSGRLVIFAGAGISTENRNVFITTLYEELKAELGYNYEDEIDFPSIVSQFCKRTNGRKEFLQIVKQRFDYAHQFERIYWRACEFHRELATLWTINTIITTNWDDYFERECGAIPIVTPEDFAFYDLPQRKVFKIHGSINNYGSLVASNEDYRKCYRNLKSGVIGGYLKTILATKVVVFIGYSFSDFDFNKVYNYLKREMKDLIPHTYVVSPFPKAKKSWTTAIETDGVYFLKVLKRHLENEEVILSDDIYDGIAPIRGLLSEIHHDYLFKKFDFTKYPFLIYTAFYQDGMQDAFDYISYMRKLGFTSNYDFLYEKAMTYRYDVRKEKVKSKDYHDVAYIDGYIWGLSFLISSDEIRPKIPLLYLYGYKDLISGPDEFESLLDQAHTFHKGACNWAERYVKKNTEIDPKIAFHHTPFL